ncbi:hypothetical protein E0H80_06160 [Acinetobacter sp. ANC 4779]|uniref:hypothetical protein n=1 Tax=Acinetobacter sp. ANC 4779 TaxID=2529848 RepID=UPI00103B5B93|nr:hypothetical protein [Acinetobacter sp. ANC 4779]TCB50950.1 hypothetical protein E0H80_06160 [Acinetobacter sp. ANC 4779]
MADQVITKQELIEAKIDVKHAGEAVNTEKVITPRYGDSFKSIPLVVKEGEEKTDAAVAALNAKADEVVAKGFYTGFSTETALKASLPNVSEMRARADDTRKIWRWSRTSAEGVMLVTGTWTDTGPSDVDVAVDQFIEEAQRQGVALGQLDEYYNYLMQRLAQIAVDKGWDSSFVVHKGETQYQVNEKQSDINTNIRDRKSVKLWAANLVDALSKYNAVDFDKDEVVITPVLLASGKTITSNNHKINQTSPSTIVVELDYGASNVTIDGLNIKQDKTGSLSGGTGNNHASVKVKGGLYNHIRNLILDGQLGVSLGTNAATAPERRSMFNTVENIIMLATNMGIEQIGSAYNALNNLFIMNPIARGVFIGDRMTGYDNIINPADGIFAPCHGNNGTNVFICNLSTGISLQNSAKYNSKINYFITECDRAVQVIPGTALGNNPTLNNLQFTSEKCGQLILNDQGNHNKFQFFADGSAFTDQGIQEVAGYTGKGFNSYQGVIKNSAKTAAQFRYSHNTYGLQVSKAVGNGANVNGSYGGGSIIVDGATGTGVALAGNYNNLQVVATECLMGLSISGMRNIINIQTDGNVTISGSGNTIIGRIGGNLTVTDNDNKFIGEVAGTVTRTNTTGNNFTGLKGWSDTVYQSAALTTDASGRVVVVVPKHASSQIRSAYATIPSNTSRQGLRVVSISGGNVMFELYDQAGAAVASTAVTFNYTYSCN